MTAAAVELKLNPGHRVYQDGDLRWRYDRRGRLLGFIEYTPGKKYDGTDPRPWAVRHWSAR